MEALLNFGTPLNMELLEQVVSAVYSSNLEQAWPRGVDSAMPPAPRPPDGGALRPSPAPPLPHLPPPPPSRR